MPRSLMFQSTVGRLGVQRDEVPEGVVRRPGLRDLPVEGLGGVDDVRELEPVLDEEHRDVADQIEVPRR